jgi:hypothetical protein
VTFAESSLDMLGKRYQQQLAFKPLNQISHHHDELYFVPEECLYRVDHDWNRSGWLLPKWSGWRGALCRSYWQPRLIRWWKQGVDLRVQLLDGVEQTSELNPGVHLDVNTVELILEKNITLTKWLKLRPQLGWAYGEFGYDHRSYIFKNGPDPTVGLTVHVERPISKAWSAYGEGSYRRTWFDGDKFENNVDDRQGEPRVSAMDTTTWEGRLGIQSHHFEHLPWRPRLALESGYRKQEILMEIGWRTNNNETMNEKHRTFSTLVLNATTPRWRWMAPMEVSARLDHHGTFGCSMSRRIPF